MIAAVLGTLLSLPPVPAAHVAAAAWGVPAHALLRICDRESRCQPVSVHADDAHLSRRGWLSQVRLGHLRPWCQPYAPGWAARGAWGLSAASHHRALPPCYPAAVLDWPIVSAFVAARKWALECEGRRAAAWCGR